MADLVSPIVDIISRLWLCCARHTRYLRKLQENKILLSTAMDELKEARNDVQRKVVKAEADLNEPKKRTDAVRGWLERVQIIEGDVEEILQKADEQLNGARCLGGCCPPNNCWSNYKVGKSIAKKIPLVNELKVKGDFQELTDQLPPSSVQDENLESTVGMESMFDNVWRLINTSTDDKHVHNIIGLYGHGGVGKTTLLEKINNEFHNKISIGEHGFDYVVIFVVVSKPINYKAIQKKIGERLGLSDSLKEDGDDEESRAQKIFNGLRNKNYVLLLDDIWEKVDKKRIGIPIIHPQGNSSKLIFTTRSERVCGEMKADKKFKVECLPWDEAWRLFKENAGEEALNYFPTARELAKIVAEECDGLPLALITIGRAMSTKKSVQQWRDAITTLRSYASEFEGMSDEVLPRLKLSYDYLRNETEKSCFRYCSLYPEDYSIEIAKVVELWIAEGFLDGFGNNLDEARDRGHTIIGSLKSACLLESSDERNHEKTHVKMHDVIRDLALWIVNDCIISTRSSDQSSNNKFLVAVNDPCKKWENAERIFWDATHYYTTSSSSSSSNNNEEEKPPISPNLLTLIVVRKEFIAQSFFQHMSLLRVLDLSYTYCFNDEFPISICELRELQYLNLFGPLIKELPVELKKLVNLKFLFLNTCGLTRIPAGVIANLSQLQVLDLGCAQDEDHLGVENWELEDGPCFSELDGLKQLQEVRITIETYVALEKFLCNRKLQMVCTGLKFCRSSSSSSPSSSSSSSSSRVLDLSNFKSLKDLVLYGFPELEKLVLYGRYNTTDGGLLSNLETLSLGGFPKLNNILWMAAQPNLVPSHFQRLHYIFIVECDALKDLTWLVNVQNLKELDVHSCKGLETIIELDDDDGLEGASGGGDQMLNTRGVFERLEVILLYDLPKLKSICSHALAFPSIETIHISYCPELKKLPLGSGSNVNNTLKQIKGKTSWWNELQWEDETIKSKFLPYFNKVEEISLEIKMLELIKEIIQQIAKGDFPHKACKPINQQVTEGDYPHKISCRNHNP